MFDAKIFLTILQAVLFTLNSNIFDDVARDNAN